MDPDFHRGDGVGPPPHPSFRLLPPPGPPRHSGESRNPRASPEGRAGPTHKSPKSPKSNESQFKTTRRPHSTPHSAPRTPHSALRTPHSTLRLPATPRPPRHSGESRKPRTPIQHSPLPIPNPPVSSSPRPTTKTPEARKGGQGQPKNHQKSPKSNESQFKTTRRPHSALPPTRHSGESRNPRTQTNHSSRQTPPPLTPPASAAYTPCWFPCDTPAVPLRHSHTPVALPRSGPVVGAASVILSRFRPESGPILSRIYPGVLV